MYRPIPSTLYSVLCTPHTWKQHKNDTFIVYLPHKVKFPGFLVHICYMAPSYIRHPAAITSTLLIYPTLHCPGSRDNAIKKANT